VSVPVTSIDAFCAERGLILTGCCGRRRIGFSVLSGACGRSLPRHACIVAEMHPNAWSVAGWSRNSADCLLEELRLTPVSMLGFADPLGSYGHVLLRPRGVQSSPNE
jgi:hypothetical protein